MATNTVHVNVVGGPSTDVPWTSGMTAQDALEKAYDALFSAEHFTYALQYYGSDEGYLVVMINETYDTFISKGGASADPFYYWSFKVNGQHAAKGVTYTTLGDGDMVEFELVRFSSLEHGGTSLATKDKRRRR